MEALSSRRGFLAQMAALGAGTRLARGAAARPNIVLILADDLGYGDLECYNRDSRIPTPNLNRLAAEGVHFTDAHSPSAVCTPTRYGMLTGRYCWRSMLKEGVLDGFDPPLIERSRLTLPALLKRGGYTTACVGKWHLGMQWTDRDGKPVPFRPSFLGGFRDGRNVDYTHAIAGGPNDAGFDWYWGISASLDMSPYCFIENNRTVGIPETHAPEDKSLFMNQVPGVAPKGWDLRDVLPACTTKSVEYIGRQKASQPFFLYVPLPAPHLPVVPNRESIGKSQAGLYGDYVYEMDASVGAILGALEKTGVARNTLVLFASDNGGLWHWWDFQEADDVAYGRITPRGQYEKDFGHQSNGPLRGTKADIWEGGHRIPLIARWPGRAKAGAASDSLVCLTDVMATCSEAVHAPLPDDAAEDSFSFLPALEARKPSGPVREDVILHSQNAAFSIRRGPWKLILHRGSGGFSRPQTVDPKAGGPKGQLYDLAHDPKETRNVYTDHPEVVESLTKLLEKQRDVGRSR